MLEPSPDLAARYVAQGWWNGETLQSMLARGLASSSGNVLHIHSKRRPFVGTVGEVADIGMRLASGLRAAGVGPGDVVAFQIPNWMEAAATFWGLTGLGATLLPIPHFYGMHELRHILAEAGARTLIIPAAFGSRDHLAEAEALRADLPALERIVIIGDTPLPTWATSFDAMLADKATPIDAPAPRPEDPAVIAYTSGTGSSPKGVILAHRALAFDTQFHIGPQVGDNPPMISGSPVSHMAGMLVSLLVPPMWGQPIHLIDVWDPQMVLDAMRTYDLIGGTGTAFFLTSLVDHPDFRAEDLAKMSVISVGGSPIPTAFVDRMASLGITLSRSYGSTEHPTTTATRPSDGPEKRRITNGPPTLGVEIRIVDGDGNDVPQGQAGEIITRGPDQSSGYLNPANTAAAFAAGGWIHSGDVGYLDRDGDLVLTDRLKDIIIRGAENISAAEVEEILLRAPGVSEVAVVAAPDERYGERACAFIRSTPGATPHDLESLRKHLAASGLTKQKWPEEVRSVDELPRTPSGKIKKSALRDLLRAEAER